MAEMCSFSLPVKDFNIKKPLKLELKKFSSSQEGYEQFLITLRQFKEEEIVICLKRGLNDLIKYFNNVPSFPKDKGPQELAKLILSKKVKSNLDSYKLKHKLKNDIELYLKGIESVNEERIRLFNSELIRGIIYSKLSGEYRLIKNVNELNKSIGLIKQQWYLKLIKYCFKNDEIFRTKYGKDGDLDKKLSYLSENDSKVNEVLLSDIEKIIHKKFKSINANTLSKLQSNYIDGKYDKCEDLDAICTFINLYNFDELLSSKDSLGNIIKINKNYEGMEYPITIDGKQILVKYTLGSDTSHIAKSWSQLDMTDAIGKTSKFSKLMLNLLQVYDHNQTWGSHLISNHTNLTSVSLAWSHLVNSIYNLEGYDDIKLKLSLIKDDPGTYLPQILEALFGKNQKLKRTLLERNSSDKESLNFLDINENDMNILFSIYHTFFNLHNPTSINSIYQNGLLRGTDNLSSYAIPDVISKLLMSSDMAAYWTTEWTYEDGLVSRRLSRNLTTNKKILDYRQGIRINFLAKTNSARQAVLKRYNFVPLSNSRINITLNDLKYTIINYSQGKESSFFKGTTSNSIIIPEMDSTIKSKLLEILPEEAFDSIINPYEKVLINNNELQTELSINELVQNHPDLDETTKLYINNWYKQIIALNKPFTDRLNITQTEGLINNESLFDELSLILSFMSDILQLPLDLEQGIRNLRYSRKRLGEVLSSAARNIFADSELLYKINHGIYNYANFAKSKTIIFGENIVDPLGNPKWIDSYFDADDKRLGLDQKAVVKGLEGNNYSLYRLTSLGALVSEELNRRSFEIQKALENYLRLFKELHKNNPATEEELNEYNERIKNISPLSSNLFVRNPKLIKSVAYDSYMKTPSASHEVKSATTNELCYNAIHNHFFHLLNSSGTFLLMPTVYSDKTSILIYLISGRTKVEYSPGLVGNFDKLTSEQYKQLYSNTVIPYYKSQFNNALDSFKKLFNRPNATVSEIRLLLNQTSPKQLEILLEQNQLIDQTLKIYKDTHYRIVNINGLKVLDFNECSYYYANEAEFDLNERIALEQKNFIKGLLKNNVLIEWDSDTLNFSYFKSDDYITTDSEKYDIYEKEWTKYGQLILAKTKSGKLILNELDLNTNEEIILNPLLETYYYMDTIASSNLKNAITGNELADPLKGGPNLKNEFNPSLKNIYGEKSSEEVSELNDLIKLFPSQYEKIINGTLIDLKEIIDSNVLPEEISKILLDKYHKLSYACIALAEGAQYKRNVILPATMEPVMCNTLTGLSTTVKKAVFEDPKAMVYGPSGKDKDIDACDGSARISPYAAILMNNSFIDSPANYDFLKMLWYGYDNNTGTSFLDKYATYTYSSKRMRQSLGSKSSEYDMFKRTHSIKWDPNIDLANSCLIGGTTTLNYNILPILNFPSILNLVATGTGKRLLLYKNELGNIVEISDFLNLNATYKDGKLEYIGNEHLYATKEQIISHGIIQNKSVLVVTLFDENSNPIKIYLKIDPNSKTGLESRESFINRVNKIKESNPNLHTVSTLFELNYIFGGLDSVQEIIDQNGSVQYAPSESSHYAVAAVMNNVQIEQDWNEEKWGPKPVPQTISINEGESAEDFLKRKELFGKAENRRIKRLLLEQRPKTQEGYKQPLKDCFIAQVTLVSASKRNTANINSSEKLNIGNNRSILYTEEKTIRWGKLSDPTHEADEAELTEMSQVVASLDVGGENHHIAKAAFNDLSKLISHAFERERNLFIQMLKIQDLPKSELNKLINKLYDEIARGFLTNYKAKSFTDFTQGIVNHVKKEFNKHLTHNQDNIYLPISDPNIFREIVQDFVSRVNGNALKRKYSGIGDVLSPAYNLIQIFHVKGARYMYLDLVKRANPLVSRKISTDTSSYTLKSSTIADIVTRAKNTKYKKPWSSGIEGSNDAYFFTFGDENGNFIFDSSNEDKSTWYSSPGFELVRITEPNENGEQINTNRYAIHFKNPNYPEFKFTELQKTQLLLAIREFLPDNATIELNGDVTSGGFSGFERLFNLGFGDTGTTSKVYLSLKNGINELNKTISRIQDKYTIDTYPSTKYETDYVTYVSRLKKIPLSRQLFDKALVDAYLKDELNSSDLLNKKILEYVPTDIIDFKVNGQWLTLNLDDPNNYYLFKDAFLNKNIESLKSILFKCPEAVLQVNGTKILKLEFNPSLWSSDKINEIIVRENITVPRNLRPQIIQFEDESGNIYNIYDLDSIKDNILNGADNNIQSDFYAIETGGIVSINGKKIKVKRNSIKGKAAELLMNNTHLSKFGLSIIASLADLKEAFTTKKIVTQKLPGVDLVLQDGNKSIAIVIDSKPITDSNYALRENYVYEEDNDGNIEIWILDKDTHEKLYMIGYSEEVNDVTSYRKDNKDIFIKNGKEIENQDDYQLRKGKYYKNTYFAKRILGKVKTDDNSAKNQLYWCFDTEALLNCKKNPNTYISKLILTIVKETKATHVLLTENSQKSDQIVDILNNIKYNTPNEKFFDAMVDCALTQLNANNFEMYVQNLKNCLEEYKNEIYNSFLLSLYFTAARIPALSLQSYMQMECIGFLGGDDNIACVSHWLTWLQGSDYDIDKAYIMGYSFNQNGKFIEWSPIFDYSSFETLEASLTIPTPSGVLISDEFDNSLDISEEIKQINELWEFNKSLAIKLLGELITKIDESAQNKQIRLINNSNDENDIVKLIKLHEQYLIPEKDYKEAMQNSISSKILRIVSDIKSILKAYSPIQMEDVRTPANKTPKGNLIVTLTSMNPYTKQEMLKQNMEGKNVISISAVGEKVFMGLSFYFNEQLRKYKISLNSDILTKLKFWQESSRILGRDSGHPIKMIKTEIADVNYNVNLFSYVTDEELRIAVTQYNRLKQYAIDNNIENPEEYAKSCLNKNNGADLMISLILSAATDNAKELILSKINCNSTFAKTYMHLIILGYNIKDVIAFMTSPAITVAVDNLNSNIFLLEADEEEVQIQEAIAKAMYGSMHSIPKMYESLSVDDIVEQLLSAADGNVVETLSEKTLNLIFTEIINHPKFKNLIKERFVEDDEDINNLFRIIDSNNYLVAREIVLNVIAGHNKTNSELIWKWWTDFEKSALSRNSAISQLRKKKDKDGNVFLSKYSEAEDEYNEDLIEFEKLQYACAETSLIGQMFGLAKEMTPDYAKLSGKISSIENIVTRRIQRKIGNCFKNDKTLNDCINKIWKEKGGYIKDDIEIDGIYTKDQIRKILESAKLLNLLESFDLTLFTNDEYNANYQNVAISLYDLVKEQFNVLDVLKNSPLYLSAAKALTTSFGILKLSSIKGNLIDKIRTDLTRKGIKCDENRLKKILRYVEDLLIKHFLQSQTIPFKFPFNRNLEFIDTSWNLPINESNDGFKSILTSEDAASFRLWFLNDFLDLLSSGTIRINGVDYDVSNLKITLYLMSGNESGQPIKKFNILMDQIANSPEVAKLYIQMLDELEKLDIFKNGQERTSLKNYFELYNILVFHNMPGNDRMSKMFINSIGKSDSILNKWLNYLGELDHNIFNQDSNNMLDTLGYSVEDAEIQTSPIYTRRSIKNATEEIIQYKNKQGFIEYRRLSSDSKRRKNKMVIKRYDEFIYRPINKENRKNWDLYHTFFTPNSDISNYTQLIFDENNRKEIKNYLLNLLKLLLLKINIRC